MATDRVGKTIRRFQDQTAQTSNYVARNLYSQEHSIDVLGPLYDYQLEFKMYNGKSALLTLLFYPRFKILTGVQNE